jgi:O-antigen/teichoic acid export membrane protein
MNQEQATIEQPPTQHPHTPGRANISGKLIAKGVFSNWAFLLTNVVIALWMTPFVVRHLGDATYGIWALVLQLTGYMGVVDVGLRSALVRFIARLKTRGDHTALNRLMSSTVMIYGAMVPGCIAIGLLISAYVLPRMQIAPSSLRMAQIAVMVASCLVGCDFLFATSHATLAGLSRWDLINGTWITMLLIRTALIVVFLKLGFGLVTLALIQLSTHFTGYVVEVVLIRIFRLVPEFQFILHKPDLQELRPVAEHSWYSLLLSLANRINYQVDTIVIGAFLPISQITFYVIGLRLVEYLRDALNASTMVVAPLVSSLEAVGDSAELGNVLVRGTKYSVTVACFGCAAFLGLGSDFIHLWMGPRFENPSGRVLIILTLGVMFSCTQFVATHILFGLSKHRINLGWTVVESILNLSFSLALVRRYDIFGVAAGTAIANLLVRGWFYPRSVLKALGVPGSVYLKRGALPAMVPAVSFLAGAWSCHRLFAIQNYAGLVLAFLVSSALFAATVWFLTLDESDREFVVTQGRKVLAGASASLQPSNDAS